MIKDSSLTPDVLEIVRGKGTERAYTGVYDRLFQQGSYLCKGCGAALFRADSKFDSTCGWPSFDEALAQAVTEQPDNDGIRTEIICTQCHAHLGHVFRGEYLTAKNKRHCVNSKCLDFVSDTSVINSEEAIVAGGCFWGIEYYLEQLPGVLSTEVGYTGGVKAYPSYNEVCSGETGHYEAIRILFSPTQLDYESLLKYFFEIHNPSQTDGQGPDRGQQYQSAIFYYNDNQKLIAEKLINKLQRKISVATQLFPVKTFWPAEEEHQHYYHKTKHQPYCHTYTKRFED